MHEWGNSFIPHTPQPASTCSGGCKVGPLYWPHRLLSNNWRYGAARRAPADILGCYLSYCNIACCRYQAWRCQILCQPYKFQDISCVASKDTTIKTKAEHQERAIPSQMHDAMKLIPIKLDDLSHKPAPQVALASPSNNLCTWYWIANAVFKVVEHFLFLVYAFCNKFFAK